MTAKPCLSGWDGGGTKTEVLITSPDGAILHRARFGSLNLNGADEATLLSTVREAAAFMDASCGLSSCAALVIGTAGISNHHAARLVEDAVRAAGYQGAFQIFGDQEIALAGAIEGCGACLTAGTGSVCCARDQNGNIFRTGGYGYLIDDEGSGYAIGRDILSCIVRAEDGRGVPTVLTRLVFEYLHILSVQDLITWLYAPETGKRGVASLAPLLLKALEERDAAAGQIADHAAQELSDLVLAAWEKAHLTSGELAFTGGILTHCPTIRSGVAARCLRIYPEITVREPRGTAAQGAAKLAKELAQREGIL